MLPLVCLIFFLDAIWLRATSGSSIYYFPVAIASDEWNHDCKFATKVPSSEKKSFVVYVKKMRIKESRKWDMTNERKQK